MNTDNPSIQHLHPDSSIIRMPETEALTGLSRSTISRRIKSDPTFPKPVRLSDSDARGAPIGFVLSEVLAWNRARISKRDQQGAAA